MKSVILSFFLLMATSRAAIITGTIPEANRLFLSGRLLFDFDESTTDSKVLLTTPIIDPGGANVVGSFTGGKNLTAGDPLLAPPGNYGGPTPTMALLPGSPKNHGPHQNHGPHLIFGPHQ